MSINSKTYYTIATLLLIDKYSKTNSVITVRFISEKLNKSKTYLEQIFTTLKKHNIVKSFRGNNGGYILNKGLNEIYLYDILNMCENNITFKNKLENINLYPEITEAIISVIDELNLILKNELTKITIEDIADIYSYLSNKNNPMYYI